MLVTPPYPHFSETSCARQADMQNDRKHLTIINGTGPANFEAEVARLLEEPDGDAAWEELKRLRRTVVPAANSPFAVAHSEGADPPA